MEIRVTGDDAQASFAQDGSGSGDGQNCPKIPSHALLANRKFWFAIMSRALWDASAPAALFDLVGQQLGYDDERQCRRWARGETQPDMSVLWLLIRSREGRRVEAFIQSHDPPEWWEDSERHRKLGADVEYRVLKSMKEITDGALR